MEEDGRFHDRPSSAIYDRGAVSVHLRTAEARRDAGCSPCFPEISNWTAVPMEHQVAHEGGAIPPRDRPCPQRRSIIAAKPPVRTMTYGFLFFDPARRRYARRFSRSTSDEERRGGMRAA